MRDAPTALPAPGTPGRFHVLSGDQGQHHRQVDRHPRFGLRLLAVIVTVGLGGRGREGSGTAAC
ncbi:hypothetical protein [Streptomyces sp. NPDC058953]|uniref:hypothetical protein n=1 Tax=Streptomyces sp. NPDC058953 TaxID=3346676 RepID=UPI0036B659B6